MHKLFIIVSIFLMSLLINSQTIQAARDTDSYDGNIYPIYAGNGSLVPPQSSLKNALENKRTSVIVFYLDDSAASKAFAPVVSGIKLLWSSTVDLIPLTIDQIQGQSSFSANEEGYYWNGNIPQIIVINGEGDVILDKEGQVPIEDINQAISKATGIKPPSFKVTIKSFNEYNSEPSKDGYTDRRK